MAPVPDDLPSLEALKNARRVLREALEALDRAAREENPLGGFHITIGSEPLCRMPFDSFPEAPLNSCWHPNREMAERCAAACRPFWKAHVEIAVVAGRCPNMPSGGNR